ncbi:hypothetical protein D3C78_1538560 [compost metagenome]
MLTPTNGEVPAGAATPAGSRRLIMRKQANWATRNRIGTAMVGNGRGNCGTSTDFTMLVK